MTEVVDYETRRLLKELLRKVEGIEDRQIEQGKQIGCLSMLLLTECAEDEMPQDAALFFFEPETT